MISKLIKDIVEDWLLWQMTIEEYVSKEPCLPRKQLRQTVELGWDVIAGKLRKLEVLMDELSC